MTNTDMADGNTRMNGIRNSLYNQSAETYAGAITWRLEARSLEDTKTKVRRCDQWISRSNSNTTTLHSECTIKNKNGNIEIFWKLNHNMRPSREEPTSCPKTSFRDMSFYNWRYHFFHQTDKKEGRFHSNDVLITLFDWNELRITMSNISR